MQKIQGWVEDGNTKVIVSGLLSATLVQKSFPLSTVTVYVTGTVTPAQIFSDNVGTMMGNPFTASATGTWGFFVANGVYDVVFSGTGISAPFTLNALSAFDESVIFVDVTAAPYSAAGNGTTDDTVAIQAAINSISSGTVYFPPGTYKCTSTLQTTGHTINFLGAGRGSTILFFPNTGVTGLNIAMPLSRVSNLTLQGPNALSVGHSGINSGNISDVTLEDCVIELWGEAGINTGGFSTRWIIRNCIIRNNQDDGVFVGISSTDCVIEGCEIYGNGSNGIDINGSRNLISNNQVRSNGARFAGSTDCWGILIAAVPAADASNNTVSNNIVSGNFGQGIIVKPTTSQATNNNLIICNQSIANSGAGGNGDGITLDGSSAGTITGNIVANNICIGNQRYGVLVDGSVSIVSQNQVRNNTCTANVHGITVTTGALDTQLTGNLVLSNSSDQSVDSGTRTSQFANKTQTADGGIYTPTRLGLNLSSGAYGILDVRSGATGADGVFLGETTNGWLLTEKGDASFALKVTASGAPNAAERLNLANNGDMKIIGGFSLAGATPTAPLGYVGIGTTEGVGNGAPVAVNAFAFGTASGPATPQQITLFLKVSVQGTDYWMPLMQ